MATLSAATVSAAAGVALAKPVATFAATHAPAVRSKTPASVWDKIAACESGGRWHINTGNGYHGGLQFKPSTWRAYGGTKYAETADKATKAQQIEIAEKVLASQGWGAWPTCSRKVGVRGAKTGQAEVAKAKHTPAKSRVTQPAKGRSGSVAKDDKIQVRPGDTLSTLAKAHNVAGGWRALYEHNRDKISDPNLIKAGWVLSLPNTKKG